MKRMAMIVVTTAVSYAMGQQVEISVPEPATVRLDWQAIPGQTYRVMTTTNLVGHPWEDAIPGGIVAGSVIGAYSEPFTAKAGFFRIQKDDTTPPEIESLVPSADAIAVQSNATVSITLTDETGIDTNSIVLTIAGWGGMTLGSPHLVYDNGTLTFVPPDALGMAGATITNIITVADTLGHTVSNYTWTFQITRPADATDDFLPLIAPPQGQGKQILAAGVPPTRIRTLANVKPLDASTVYEIVSVTSNTVVFSYQGTPPDMPNGKRLVSFDAAHPFYRQSVSNLVDAGQSQITVWTVDIALTDLATEGSLSSASFVSADPAPLHVQATTSDLNLLHVEFGDDLSGTVLFEDSGLKLHLPQASWGFVGDVDVAFDLFFAELRSLDASAKGTITLDLSPEALFYQAVNGDGELPLVQPVTKVFGAMVGPVPVWVEVIMELNAGYEYSASVSGVVNTRVHAEKELTFYVKLRQNQWTHGVNNPPIVLEADPIYWQLEGTANAKVYVQPKLTVLVYSLAGLWADMQPYAEFDGRYQLNPLEYDLGLYLGMSSTLGIESRVWYEASWGPKPEWQLFDMKWPMWSSVYPTESGMPVFASQLGNHTVVEGDSLLLSAQASGNPQYQWFFNGQRIVGAVSPSFALQHATASAGGDYKLVAKNNAGSSDTTAHLTVVPRYGGSSWRYPRYDRAGTSANPYGSRVRTGNTLSQRFSKTSVDSMLTGDVDGDGLIDIVTSSGSTIRIFTGNGTLQRTISLPRTSYVAFLEDADGDGILDIALGGGGSGFSAYVYRGDGTLLKTFPGQHAGGSDIVIHPLCISGNRFLVGYDAGYARTPRGMASFNYSTGAEQWYYQVGPAYGRFSVADMNSDGVLDIVKCAATVHNGASGNGTTDGDLYLIAVDESGIMKVSQKYPAPSDGGAMHLFADVDLDGQVEILGFEEHDSTYYPGTSQIHVFSTSGATLRTWDGPSNTGWTYAVGDVDGNGSVEIVATATRTETTYLLNSALQVQRQATLSGQVKLLCDLNGDGKKEVVLLSNSGLLRVLDANLIQIAGFQCGAQNGDVIASDVNGDGRTDLLVRTDKLYVLSF